MKKNQMHKKIIWIIGGTSGIGLASALRFHSDGHQVIVSGRSNKNLNVLDTKEIYYEQIDAEKKDSFFQAGKNVASNFGYIDTLFLNIGTCEYIDIKNFNSDIFKLLMEVNFMSMIYGIEIGLPLLRRSKMPHLVGMSSTVGYLGLPKASAYSASKAAIYNLLESLRIDLLPEKIPVSIICPGFVKTPLTDRNTFKMPGIISSEKAAEYIVKGIYNKDYVIEFPKWFAFIAKFLAALPNTFTLSILSKMSS
ncbi:MAG: SDR family NAD(P)-dependent oxidoreductase [Gammaproteobacteria bacterium]